MVGEAGCRRRPWRSGVYSCRFVVSAVVVREMWLVEIKSHHEWDQRVFKSSNPGKFDCADSDFGAELDCDPGLSNGPGIVQSQSKKEMTGICADSLFANTLYTLDKNETSIGDRNIVMIALY